MGAMDALDTRLIELLSQGKTKNEVAQILKSEGFITKRNKRITEAWVASRKSFLAYTKKNSPYAKFKEIKPEMLTIPIAEKEEGKIVAIYGSVDAVSEMIRKWVSNG